MAGLIDNLAEIHLEKNASMAHMASITFDPAVYEIWGSLLTGITCVIIPEYQQYWDPKLLKQQIRQFKVDALVLSTPQFNYLVNNDVHCIQRKVTYDDPIGHPFFDCNPSRIGVRPM